MAEYIRFKWTRAKAGVTMAFLALLGGLTSEAGAKRSPGDVRARESKTISWTPKLSLNGLSGNLRTSLLKVEKDLSSLYQKDQKAFTALAAKENKAISAASLKIERQLDSNFLTQSDAGKVYLKIEGEAANSAELGGEPASAFIHGGGGIVTGGTTATFTGGLMPLVTTSDGSLTVKAEITQATGPALAITNNTLNAMTWVATIGGQITGGTLGGGATATLPLTGGNNLSQATVQLLPAVQSQAFTLTVSTFPLTGPSGGQQFVAQMVNGDG